MSTLLDTRAETLARTILASLLSEEGAGLPGIAQTEIVHAGAFYDLKQRCVYMVICDLFNDGVKWDIMGLADKLSKITSHKLMERAKLAEQASDSDSDKLVRRATRITDENGDELAYDALQMVGGHVWLIDLASEHVTNAAFGENCKNLWQTYMRRRTIKIMDQRSTELKRGIGDLDEWVEGTQTELIRIQNAGQTGAPETVDAAVDEALADMEKIQSGIKSAGVKTNITYLDAVLGYLRAGSLNILAARPSQGKTTFALNMLVEMERAQKCRCLFISMEVTKKQLAQKLASRISGVSFGIIESGSLGKDKKCVGEAFDELRSFPLDFVDEPRITIETLRARVIRYRAEHPDLSCVFIDYLQLFSAKHRQSDYEKISEISRELKILAGVIDVPIVALSQLSRDKKGEKPRVPGLSDLRGSGSLEQDADVVIFLHTTIDGDKEREMIVRIAKNRFGACMDLTANFKVTAGRFEVRGKQTNDKKQQEYSDHNETPKEWD